MLTSGNKIIYDVIYSINTVNIFIYLIIGYFFGSIPVGFLICKSKNINIFEVGSKNPGSTNVGRVLGKKYGNLTFVLDIFKTILPILISVAFYLYNSKDFSNRYNIFYDLTSNNIGNDIYILSANIKYIILTVGLGCILGHNFSIFTKFKGGKGITVTVATIACFNIIYAIVLYLVYKVVSKISRYVSLGSIIALIVLFLSCLLLSKLNIYPYDFKYNGLCKFYLFIYMALGIIRHKDNIYRLINNKENKID